MKSWDRLCFNFGTTWANSGGAKEVSFSFLSPWTWDGLVRMAKPKLTSNDGHENSEPFATFFCLVQDLISIKALE